MRAAKRPWCSRPSGISKKTPIRIPRHGTSSCFRASEVLPMLGNFFLALLSLAMTIGYACVEVYPGGVEKPVAYRPCCGCENAGPHPHLQVGSRLRTACARPPCYRTWGILRLREDRRMHVNLPSRRRKYAFRRCLTLLHASGGDRRGPDVNHNCCRLRPKRYRGLRRSWRAVLLRAPQ